MIQFFGNEIPVIPPPEGNVQGNLAAFFNITEDRARVISDAIVQAKTAACNEPAPTVLGMPSFMRGFNIIKFLELIEVDALSPNELLLAGMLAGRTYEQVAVQSDALMKKATKMMHLMATNPAKAHKKMLKSIKKKAKANGK